MLRENPQQNAMLPAPALSSTAGQEFFGGTLPKTPFTSSPFLSPPFYSVYFFIR